MHPKIFLRRSTLIATLLATATVAWAGVDITTRNASAQGESSAGRIRAQGDKLRIDLPASSVGRPNSSILFDATENVMRILQHDDKSYWKIDRVSAAKLGAQFAEARRQMEEQFAKMEPKQRAMMEKMMGQQGMPPMAGGKPKPPAPPSTKRTARSDTVHGTKCTIYEIQRAGKVAGESCIANWDALPIKQSDIAVMEKFAAFQLEMTEQFGKLFAEGQQPFAAMELSKGLPVRARSIYDGETSWESSFESIEHVDPNPDIFSVPKGYTPRKVGDM